MDLRPHAMTTTMDSSKMSYEAYLVLKVKHAILRAQIEQPRTYQNQDLNAMSANVHAQARAAYAQILEEANDLLDSHGIQTWGY